MSLWSNLVEYYTTIGQKYEVDPLIFVGIHIVATPVFAACVGWIIFNRKKRISIIVPSIAAIFVFNAASIYLVIFGTDIPFYIYLVVGLSAVVTGYFTFKKIKKRITAIDPK